MSLPPYQYHPHQPLTPRATPSPKVNQNGHFRHESSSSTKSSPEYASTRGTTPGSAKPSGPMLLPRIRTQIEQSTDSRGHRRAQSHDITPSVKAVTTRPHYQRSSTTPPRDFPTPDATPISALSTTELFADASLDSPACFAPTYADISNAHSYHAHSRHTSTSSLDVPSRLYNTAPYRFQPVFRQQSPMPAHRDQSPQYIPAVETGISDFEPAVLPAQAPPPMQCLDLPSSREFDFTAAGEPAGSLIDYFTMPNPAINLVADSTRGTDHVKATHCWWDVRNVRKWNDFDLDTINGYEDLKGLLNNPYFPMRSFIHPRIDSKARNPDKANDLFNSWADHFTTKVNLGLRATQGSSRRAVLGREATQHDGPFFVSRYEDVVAESLSPARVIGIVKAYETWNTGMKHEPGQRKVDYLSGLAHLQRIMREHDCRYGFIMNEVELVCVRMGTEIGRPYFGLLEVSQAIRMEAKEGLTACIALWYLHMLTSDTPVSGQCGWKVDVGPPAALTRKHVLKQGIKGRDDWMPPKINQKEERTAKHKRGWVWPENPPSRQKEGIVKGRR